MIPGKMEHRIFIGCLSGRGRDRKLNEYIEGYSCLRALT